MKYRIPFNKPFLSGKELTYIRAAVRSGKISGDGNFSKKCQAFFEERWHFEKTLLTASCTDALEMAALLLRIVPGDEVIMPAYTFVSTANAFVLRGAKIIFADSSAEHPNVTAATLEALITPRTRAIVLLHYGGVACNLEPIVALAEKHGIAIVEDAAHAVDAYYKGVPLGSFGALGTFSFHETKNVIAGEGGLLAINDVGLVARAEIIREKGTNRSAFFRGETDRYNWVDIGSSYLPSELTAAFLYAQLEQLERIQTKRIHIWECYWQALRPLEEKGVLKLPVVPDYATHNAHVFYILCASLDERSALIMHLKKKGILAVFHYLSLHKSPFYQHQHDGSPLPYADYFSDHLLRLPLYFELTDRQIEEVAKNIFDFYA